MSKRIDKILETIDIGLEEAEKLAPKTIEEACEDVFQFHMPLDELEKYEAEELDKPMNMGINAIRHIYSAGTSELAERARNALPQLPEIREATEAQNAIQWMLDLGSTAMSRVADYIREDMERWNSR